jgi:hypothetical protein
LVGLQRTTPLVPGYTSGVLIKELVQIFWPPAEVCLPKPCNNFAELNQASLGGFIKNGKRSETFLRSASRQASRHRESARRQALRPGGLRLFTPTEATEEKNTAAGEAATRCIAAARLSRRIPTKLESLFQRSGSEKTKSKKPPSEKRRPHPHDGLHS